MSGSAVITWQKIDVGLVLRARSIGRTVSFAVNGVYQEAQGGPPYADETFTHSLAATPVSEAAFPFVNQRHPLMESRCVRVCVYYVLLATAFRHRNRLPRKMFGNAGRIG